MSCLFCQIAEKKIPSRLAIETDRVYGFHDINPQAPIHVLLIPKRHVSDISEVDLKDAPLLSELFSSANQIAKDLQVAEKGYRLVINCKSDGGQTVDHLHLHLMAGRRMTWPPG